MGKDKIRRFREFKLFGNSYDFPYHLKGKWNQEVFGNSYPIVLELGCGKGEYTVALAREFPEKNFIGIDIKSNRMWKGAGISESEELRNAAFVRIVIDKITEFFDPGEVSEVWITFPDPFPKDRHAKHRLTHPRFLSRYKQVLKPTGIIHFKTDDDGLFNFTEELFSHLGITPLMIERNVHGNPDAHPHLKQIRTYYENLFMGKGRTIKYALFGLDEFNDEKGNQWEANFKEQLKQKQDK